MSNFSLTGQSGLDKWVQSVVARRPYDVEVGFFSEARYPDSKGTRTAAVAAWNEFGTRTIPERPFFRRTLQRVRRPTELPRLVRRMLDKRTMTLSRQAYDAIGAYAVGELQNEIVSLRHPPNAPSTVKRKGSTNPLIDTGQLRTAATWKVKRAPRRG